MDTDVFYHIGFSRADLGDDPPLCALLCGDPDRTTRIATAFPGITEGRLLSGKRGLVSYLASLQGGMPLLCATSGMGAPSTSIVLNELYGAGVRVVIRVGTTGGIQPEVRAGHVVISRAALCRQGAADDIAPKEYPASANPFLTAALVQAARELGVNWHLGVTASVDTFYEGQERTDSSARRRLLRRIRGITEEYAGLGILNYEMETGTLFKMAGVYGFAAAGVLAVISERTRDDAIDLSIKEETENAAISVAVRALMVLDPEYLSPRYWR